MNASNTKGDFKSNKENIKARLKDIKKINQLFIEEINKIGIANTKIKHDESHSMVFHHRDNKLNIDNNRTNQTDSTKG